MISALRNVGQNPVTCTLPHMATSTEQAYQQGRKENKRLRPEDFQPYPEAWLMGGVG